MGRRGRTGDSKYVAILQTLRGSVVTAELGKIAKEALLSGWDLKTLARAVGVNHVTVMKWLKAAEGVGNNSSSKRGRPSGLDESHAAVLRQLASNPATAHLPAKVIWELYLKHFECSPECQANSCPHETVSYYTAWRFLQTLPVAYGEQKSKRGKRFRSSHAAIVPPSAIWLFDRSKSDVLLIANEMTGEVKRFEIAAAIDRGTMTCLALSAVERDADEPTGKSFNPYYDAVAFNAIVADSLCGTLTGVKAKPKAVVIDWGKVENNKAFIETCKRLRISLQRARPYDPGSKAEVEGFFSFVHSQLEAYLPGYVGSNNQRPETRPMTTESGKAHRKIDPTTGEIYWVDDSERRLLTVVQFNELLHEWARKWNAQVSPKWQQPRLKVFQDNATKHYEVEELLRIQLLPAIVRKIRTDGEVVWREHRWWNPIACIYAGFGDYRHLKVRIAPDHRCWLFTMDDEPVGGSLKQAEAAEVPIWRWSEGSVVMECWTEFKRAIRRRVNQIVDESLKIGRSVDDTIEIYKNELIDEFNRFLANPRSFMPYKQPQPLEDETPRMSLEEELELLHEIGNYLEQETRAQREKVWQRNQPRFEGWIWENEEEEAINDAPSSNSAV